MQLWSSGGALGSFQDRQPVFPQRLVGHPPKPHSLPWKKKPHQVLSLVGFPQMQSRLCPTSNRNATKLESFGTLTVELWQAVPSPGQDISQGQESKKKQQHGKGSWLPVTDGGYSGEPRRPTEYALDWGGGCWGVHPSIPTHRHFPACVALLQSQPCSRASPAARGHSPQGISGRESRFKSWTDNDALNI